LKVVQNPFPYQLFLAPKFWPTWAALGFARLIVLLLPMRALAALGHSIGMAAYHLGSSRRKVALKNIQTCFPDFTPEQCEHINREQFGFIGQSIFTTLANMWDNPIAIRQRITVLDRRHYDQALNEGRNIIILAPHFIGLDAGGVVVGQDHQSISMYQRSNNPLMDEVIKRGRARYGGEMFERKTPLRRIIKAIRQGKPYYYLPDQDAGRKGLFVPFFGTPASTIPALGRFAQLGKAVVIPIKTRVLPKGKGYEVSFGEPLADFPTGDDVHDTTVMNTVIADMIRTMPEQYFWVHKRFKTRPPQETEKFYS